VRRDNELAIANTADAQIELADIPFVRLRPLLGGQMKRVQHSWEELLQLAQLKIDLDLSQPQPEQLIISLPKRKAWFGDNEEPLRLTGVQLALFAYFADTKANHCVKPELRECGDCTECFQSVNEIETDRFVRLWQAVFPRSPHGWEDLKSRKTGKTPGTQWMSPENFRTYRNRINSAVGEPSLHIVRPMRTWGDTRYGLALDKTRIRIDR
jgi:hypothetical protein